MKMNELDKILELLEKDGLSPDEQKVLDELLSAVPDSGKIVKTFNSLKNSFDKDSHPDEVLIGEYVLYKNDMLDDKRTMFLLENKIDDHLRICDECKNVFTDLNSEYADVDSFLADSIRETKPNEEIQNISAGFFRKFTAGRFAYASIAAIVIIYLGMFAASSVFVPDYKKHAISEDERGFYNTRGRTSELFQRGLNAIDKKEYNSAILLLEEDINSNINKSSIFYSHFILGVTYIQSSESSFLGTFKSFDKEKIENGITNLKKAIELNLSGKYENLNLDAHYFAGKAYMLIDEKDSAAEHLKIVVSNKGSYYKKAQELLDKINTR